MMAEKFPPIIGKAKPQLKTKKGSITTDVKSDTEDSGFSSKTCDTVEDLTASKSKIVRIDSKPTALEERSHSFKLPSIPGEKYEWKLIYSPLPMKSIMKLPHHSLITNPKPLSSIRSKKASSEPLAESHKLPPIEKLSMSRLPRPMHKSSTWPVVGGVRLPPIPSLSPKYPPSTLLMQKLSVTSTLEKLQQKSKQKYMPTLPIFKPDLKTGEETQTQEPMDIRKVKQIALEEVRSYN